MIVPSYRDTAALLRCLASLQAQTTGVGFEVIVSASADTPDELPVVPTNDRVRLLSSVPRRLPAPARNAAVETAQGEVLLFTDADVVVPPTWIDDMLRDWDGEGAMAGGVLNGTPHSLAGTAEYLCEFLDFSPGRTGGDVWHGATCNLLVPRALWDDFGPFPELIGAEDTAFTHRLALAGLLKFSPRAVVEHRNRTALRRVLAHQYQLGRHQAALAASGPHPWHGVLLRPWLAPAAGSGRAVLIASRSLRYRAVSRRRLARVAPVVMAGMTVWSVGLAREGRRLRRRLSLQV